MRWELLAWCLFLGVFWTVVVQVIAAFTTGPIPWLAAGGAGLALGLLAAPALTYGFRRLDRDDSSGT